MNPPPTVITVETRINAPVAKVWAHWVTPAHIVQWNATTDDWHCPSASNDLTEGGTFSYRMEARDGSMGFDFSGSYTEVVPLRLIAFRIGDGRETKVVFVDHGAETVVSETFVAEDAHSAELQRSGWQTILNRFKSQVESHA